MERIMEHRRPTFPKHIQDKIDAVEKDTATKGQLLGILNFINWRCDNIMKIVIDLAERVGHHEFAQDITKFHNETYVLSSNRELVEEIIREALEVKDVDTG